MTNEEYTQLMECLHKLETRIDVLEAYRRESEKTFDEIYYGIKRVFNV